jgi:ribosome-associated protein
MKECVLKEVHYRTSRSSGAGGQHVNKTETRVELIWDPAASSCLTGAQKARVMNRLGKRLNDAGQLGLRADRERSQHLNREEVRKRFLTLLEYGLAVPKARIATRPTRSSKEKRLKDKKVHSERKRLRKDPPRD